MANTHKDVEFVVDDHEDRQRTFKTFNEAAAFAVIMAATREEVVNLDVLIYSRSGARWWGGDDAVEEYNEDPEASVTERIEIRVNSVGRVA